MQQIIGDPSSNGVCFFCHTDEKTVPFTAFLFDPLAPNSYDSGDIDPYMIYVSGNTANTFSPIELNDNSSQFCTGGWLMKNTPSQAFVKIPALVLANFDSGYSVPLNVGSNPYASEDQFFPIVYARPTLTPAAPPYGYKGVSYFMQWCGTQRTKLAVIGLNSAGDSVILNNVILPWNNSVLIT